jgi:hypothetical protein
MMMDNKKILTISSFSAGVSSAVATKLMIDQIDKIIYIHIDDQHKDTLRFVKECEEWFGKKVDIMQAKDKSVDTVCRRFAFIKSPHGAKCTAILKRAVRKQWEKEVLANGDTKLRYVWGMDCNEKDRAERLEFISMPESDHYFPLIEADLLKEDAHAILKKAGIRRPAMYDLGYHNNNCIGCVKGGMGYWNKIRVDFPEVFKARAKLERDIGASCINGVYLDELEPERGRHDGPICEACGIMCELNRV